MSETKYTLTTLLSDLLALQNNGYEIMSKLSEVVSSKSDTVEILVLDPENRGSFKTVKVPSFGSMKEQISALSKNVEALSGVGESASNIQLSDGSFRKILVSSLQKEADSIKSVSNPTSFATKENWFFESFLNPLMFVTYDLTNQVKFNTENVDVARYILSLDTFEKTQVFEQRLKGRSDISFDDFERILIDYNIAYFLDKAVTEVPPRSVRFYGDFSVLNVEDSTISNVVDGVTIQNRQIIVQLDNLFYNDANSPYLATQSLKIGDFVVVNNGRGNTRYEITSIDGGQRKVALKLIEGFDPVSIGASVLSFYTEDISSITININVGFNENCVVFIKPIDPDSKLEAVKWSPGSSFYTNELTIIDQATGNTVFLSDYYKNSVIDFGAFLYSMSKEKVPPAIFGLTPDAPKLNVTDFKVVQINNHLTDTSPAAKLKKLQADKIRISADIASLDASVNQLRSKIQTVKYTTTRLRDVDENKLNALITQKDAATQLYGTTVNEIVKIGTDPNSDINPKYRLRGFFPMPQPKLSDRTAPQQVIQFVVQYRYLQKNGSANSPQQLGFTDNNGQPRTGTFSTWTEYKSEVRKRSTDPATASKKWVVEDVENPDYVNINQIDIAIQAGEAVEFKVQSLSEAGWPISPATSVFSETIKVDFPSELEVDQGLTQIIEQAKQDKVRVDLELALIQGGVPQHISTSFTQGENYWAHNSFDIASGFLTPENNILSLFDKLNDLQVQIQNLAALITVAKGVIVVKVVDSQGTEYTVEANKTLKLFAGNYKDEVAGLNVKKGVIITKNYFVQIQNADTSPLEMYARIWGSKYQIANASYSAGLGYLTTDSDYNTVRRYDYVPLALSNPATLDVNRYGIINRQPEQSAQVRGQFINSRYLAVDGITKLFSNVGGATYGVERTDLFLQYGTGGIPSATIDANAQYATSLDQMEFFAGTTALSAITSLTNGQPTSDFIWKPTPSGTFVVGSTSSIINTFYNSDILIHVDHPSIIDWQTASAGSTANLLNITKGSIRNSRFATIQVPNYGYGRQTALYFNGASAGAIGATYSKVAYVESDQYLLGPKSCGSYLFLNPNTHGDVVVDGSGFDAVKTVQFGGANAINIPITYQYRMTDYFGFGTSGLGKIGGSLNASPNANVEYSKTIGIDIYSTPKESQRFSFDIEFTSRYRSNSIVGSLLPVTTFESQINTLTNVVKNINPTVTQIKGTGISQVSSAPTPKTAASTKSLANTIKSGGGGGGGCPDPMTPISISRDLSIIAGELNVGDMIYTMHENTKEFGMFRVMEATPIEQEKFNITFTDGTSIKVSDTHQFFMSNEEWMRAYNLTEGLVIKGLETDKVIKSIESIGIGTVIKFEIEDAHTYISDGLISHNKVALTTAFNSGQQ